VSNLNSIDTHCKTLYLGVSATDNQVPQGQIVVSPSPFRDHLNVALSATLRSPVFHLYDQMGRLLYKESMVWGINEVETSSLPPGMYFWEVVSTGNRVKAGKIVKTGQ
jgi:hypothetical protein